MTKQHDAIIDELHRYREQVGRAHGFDVDRIAAAIRQHERESGRVAEVITVTRARATRSRVGHPAHHRAGPVGA